MKSSTKALLIVGTLALVSLAIFSRHLDRLQPPAVIAAGIVLMPIFVVNLSNVYRLIRRNPPARGHE